MCVCVCADDFGLGIVHARRVVNRGVGTQMVADMPLLTQMAGDELYV